MEQAARRNRVKHQITMSFEVDMPTEKVEMARGCFTAIVMAALLHLSSPFVKEWKLVDSRVKQTGKTGIKRSKRNERNTDIV